MIYDAFRHAMVFDLRIIINVYHDMKRFRIWFADHSLAYPRHAIMISCEEMRTGRVSAIRTIARQVDEIKTIEPLICRLLVSDF